MATTDTSSGVIGHPAKSPKFRKDTGYISDRHEYYSEYYQKNKTKLNKKKKDRYASSSANREYHKKKASEWYHKNKTNTGTVNRTVMRAEDGRRLYSIRHAANALGLSISYFRDLIRNGIVPEASIKASGRWRMYTEGQIKLLKRASVYYYQYTEPNRMQAVLFCFWRDADTAMAMSEDRCLLVAIERMKKKATRADSRHVVLLKKF